MAGPAQGGSATSSPRRGHGAVFYVLMVLALVAVVGGAAFVVLRPKLPFELPFELPAVELPLGLSGSGGEEAGRSGEEPATATDAPEELASQGADSASGQVSPETVPEAVAEDATAPAEETGASETVTDATLAVGEAPAPAEEAAPAPEAQGEDSSGPTEVSIELPVIE